MKTKERLIVHSDINHCFAQIEEMKNPKLRNVPMVVGGSQEERHGIVLARNMLAKKFGVMTAEPLVSARKKCPQLIVVAPAYDDYLYYSEQVKDIYREYTDKVESFGIDEAWFELTHSQTLFGDGLALASHIQKRVFSEVGLTVSMGISWNKIFAKLGSDMVKPSGFTHISRDNYKDLAWSLPVSDLLYVGPSTQRSLLRLGILTIGELARSNPETLIKRLGKQGDTIWYFANGLDQSEVKDISFTIAAKSVGNSITTKKDIVTPVDAMIVYRRLSESVASRLRDANQVGSVISIGVRDVNLKSFSRQRTLKDATDVSDVILSVAMELLTQHYDFEIPLRSIGVSVSKLKVSSRTETFQLNLFEDVNEKVEARIIDRTIDDIRDRYGFDVVKRCSVLLDEDLSDLNPKEKHVIFPPGNYKQS